MNRRGHRLSDQTGSVLLVALLIMLVVTAIGVGLMNSFLGEGQGVIATRHAVSVLAVAEGGVHWAGNRLTGVGAETYAGEADQVITGPGGQQVGVFDAEVFCLDGVTSPSVDACAAVQPNQRLVRVTGYVPAKAAPAGQRRIQAVVVQNTFFNKAICAYNGVTLDQGVVVEGDVGSEGDISLAGPPLNPSQITATGPGIVPPQPGNASAVGTITCSVNCGTQVAGSVNPGQAPGSVCPPRTEIRSTYVCTPGAIDLTVPNNGTATIDSANRFLDNIRTGRNATLIFDTTGAPGGILEVHATDVITNRDTQFLVQGGGKVRLHLAEQLLLAQGNQFGIDASTGNPVAADRIVVKSCSDNNPSPAIHFNQTGRISGLFIVPDGTVEMDQAQLTDGAILADHVQLDQGTDFDFDGSAVNIGFGFNRLTTWQDVPSWP